VKRRIWIGFITAAILLLLLCSGVVYWALRSYRPFYQAALAIPQHTLDEKNREFLNRTSRFSNLIRNAGKWSILLTDEQINGWLAVDLQQNHPDALPDGVHDPRIAIFAGYVSGGVLVDREPFPVAASLDVEIRLVEAQKLAVKIRDLRLGTLPWTLDRVVLQIAIAAQENGWGVEQTTSDNQPVLLLTLPERFQAKGTRIVLEAIELRAGEVLIAGRTELEPESDPHE
jgi:hypothetical protein